MWISFLFLVMASLSDVEKLLSQDKSGITNELNTEKRIRIFTEVVCKDQSVFHENSKLYFLEARKRTRLRNQNEAVNKMTRSV